MKAWRPIVIAALMAAGFGLTCFVFYPGVETFDARYVYLGIKEGAGDWQSPVMTALWALIDPIAPGVASMFLLTAAHYWAGFGFLALGISRRSFWPAVLLPLLALSPPAFAFAGIIWRDILMAVSWLLAAALTFGGADKAAKFRWPVQAAAFGLVCFGVLLRPNALVAAPLLASYVIWPSAFRWKRIALLSVPAMIGFYALIQVAYYGILDAKRQTPLHSVLVYDLGGITHFAKENQFPVSWTPEETALLIDGCYKPTFWDIYWIHEPCRFVMARLDAADDKIFGTRRLVDAWVSAVLHHPIAYLSHRASFMWQFLARQNLTMWVVDVDNPSQVTHRDKPAFMALKSLHDSLAPTFVFRAGIWFLLSLAVCALGWPRRGTPEGAFALGVCGSAFIYVASFFVFGVAADFRYAYWAVLASMAGGVVLAARPGRLIGCADRRDLIGPCRSDTVRTESRLGSRNFGG